MSRAAAPEPQAQPQRGNPDGIRARATDHAVRRYAERALGVWIEGMDDGAAIAALRARGINVGAIRRKLSILGGLGVANDATAVTADGLKLVISDRAVVTVLAKKLRQDLTSLNEASAAPAPRKRTILDRDYAGHD
jgi:hypothetical protein